jgi:serine protease Do
VTLGRLEDGEKLAKADDNAPTDIDTGSAKSLGMSLLALSPEARKTFKLKDSLNGVVISDVDPSSAAAEKGLHPGDVIEEVNQQAVSKPGDVSKAIDALKKQGKKSALLLVANGQGEVRFIALALN